MALDFFAGCLGGCAGIVVGYPLDTIKVHMQTQDYRNPKYKGNWHCFRTLLAKESVAGLYRGMSSPMAGVAMVNAIIFGVYGQTQKHIPNPDSLSSHFIAGALAGITQSPICSPIELAKTRLQLQVPNTQFSSPIQCLKHTYKHEGHRGVFKGLNITFLREAPSFGIYFLTYEAITRASGNGPVSTPCMLLAGGFAGTASWVLTYPLDVVKSRIQADNCRYAGVIDCLKKSVRIEGVSCLYRGLSSTILRAFPTNAVTFAVVTWTFRLFGQNSIEASQVKTEPRIIENIPEVHEPFLRNWETFLTTIVSTNNLMLSSSLYRVNRWTQVEIKCNVAEEVCDKDEKVREKGDIEDGSGKRKVESTSVERTTDRCGFDDSCALRLKTEIC